MTFTRVSIHGGHSGQFCNHAQDMLEEIVRAYIEQGFAWVGITEHMPPSADAFLYPEERAAGLTMDLMKERFGRYMAEARRLQKKYAGRIEILVGFETEDTTGAIDLAKQLIVEYGPDYILGSVHHIADIPFDYNAEAYQEAVASAGGIEALYCSYFDRQHQLIKQLAPQVVGHFDLIRIFDPLYRRHLMLREVQKRIQRNLELIRKLDLALDFNVAALKKGASEPYISRPILAQVRRFGIPVVPGDDAHSVQTVGLHLDEGIAILKQMGFDTRWRKPMMLKT
ncbi:MAG: histidinol-phosphatase HisJ [Desulfobacteraceae bacterium]|nr:MAG: histidinol-phosphatase HisJ [Desulfobacteraceae bacterium]